MPKGLLLEAQPDRSILLDLTQVEAFRFFTLHCHRGAARGRVSGSAADAPFSIAHQLTITVITDHLTVHCESR